MEMINDHFQNFKRYQIPKAQLVIADIPYNIGKDAYGSNPRWYVGGDRANGESEKANKYANTLGPILNNIGNVLWSSSISPTACSRRSRRERRAI